MSENNAESAGDSLDKYKESENRTIDVTDPAENIYQHIPKLDLYCENMSEKVSDLLSSYLRCTCELKAMPIKLGKFDPLLKADDQPVFDRIFKVKSMGGYIAFVLPSDVTFQLVDLFYGGTGALGESEVPREMSQSENFMLDKVAQEIVGGLTELLESATSLEFSGEIQRWSYQQAAQEGTSESMIAIPFEMNLNSNTVVFEVWLSLSVIELLLGVKLQPDSTGKVADPAWSMSFKNQVMDSELNLTGSLASLRMPLRRVQAFSEGDFIELGDVEHALFSTESVPLFRAKVGVTNDKASASFLHWV